MPSLPSLPIDAVLPQVLTELQRHGAVVLTSPPGSGKTTRVPAAVLDRGVDGAIWVLQPRRLAARAAARRVAKERQVRLGDEVGYQVRHDRKASKTTRIRFVTEGVLVRQLVRDPFLPGVAAVVLDEFHERSLEADLAIAMLREVRETVREDLLLLVMSATLDPEPVVQFLGRCGAITAEGRVHDVAVHYLPAGRRDLPAARSALATAVRQAVLRGLEDTEGDVLVFLPGVGEIQRCAAELAEMAERRDLAVHPLHGQLDAEQQDAAIVPGPRRKVVLATNVAETSITIQGVTAVVDSGLARQLRHDTGRGLDRLVLEPISRAAAEQRRGRAGRTGPGTCYRLWSVAEERGRPAFDTPEIRRVDLCGLALQVHAFAGRDPRQFGWFEPPEPASLATADDLLNLLGAVAEGRITELGQAMLSHPLHPRLARMMEEGRRRGCPRAAAELAALLSEREIQRPDQRQAAVADLFELRGLLHEVEDAGFAAGLCRRLDVDPRAARAVVRVRDQIAGRARDQLDVDTETGAQELVKTLMSGYPDRVCCRESTTEAVGVMATGRGFRLTMTDHEDLGTLFLALQVRDSADRRKNRALLNLACGIEEPWLQEVFPGSVRELDITELDRERGAVVVHRRRMFGNLVLAERGGGQADPEQAAQLIAEELARDPWRYLGKQRDLREWLARVEWLRRQHPEAGLRELGDAEVAAAAATLCSTRTRLSELRDAPVLDLLRHSLPAEVQRLLRREAPERVELPSGRQARIDYTTGPEPFVAARLQEFFGLADTPRLAGGRVPLLLHLLAPNQRPVQITSDLQSFWANVYPDVRKELRRRYPKHSWPEDPLAAAAEARPKRRR